MWSSFQEYRIHPFFLTHFIIDLTRRDRHCESPFETFFKDQCLYETSKFAQKTWKFTTDRTMKVFVTVQTWKETTLCGWFIGMKPVNATFKILRYIRDCVTNRIMKQTNQFLIIIFIRAPATLANGSYWKMFPNVRWYPKNAQRTDNTFMETSGSKCWKIGNPCTKLTSGRSNRSSSPPSVVKVVQVEQSDDGNLRIFCHVNKNYIRAVSAVSAFSLGFNSCYPGTYRNRFGKCSRGFFG